MSVTLSYTSNLNATEVLESNVPAVATTANKEVKHTGFNKAVTLNGSSTPPATKVAAFEQALAAGAATIDLAALTGTNGVTIDGTGLKVQAIKLVNKAANANAMTLSIGASNGYDGWGANFEVDIAPGAEVVLFTNDAGSDIGATKKTLDIAGSGTETAQIIIIMG